MQNSINTLPSGWELRYTSCAPHRVYYVDHNTHTTCWTKPHILGSTNSIRSPATLSPLNVSSKYEHTEIECSKIAVRKALNKGLGAFAVCDITKNDLVEKGIVRRIDYDGNCSPHLFSWSEDRTIWAFGSGCTTFYNTSRNPNTKMIRFYDEDRYEIYALREIKKNEELTHRYKSLEWRT